MHAGMQASAENLVLLAALLLELALLLGGRVLVLLVLGDEIVHVGLGLRARDRDARAVSARCARVGGGARGDRGNPCDGGDSSSARRSRVRCGDRGGRE